LPEVISQAEICMLATSRKVSIASTLDTVLWHFYLSVTFDHNNEFTDGEILTI